MQLEIYTVGYQLYILPAINITYTTKLNGAYEINLCWFNKGISLRLVKHKL